MKVVEGSKKMEVKLFTATSLVGPGGANRGSLVPGCCRGGGTGSDEFPSARLAVLRIQSDGYGARALHVEDSDWTKT